MAKVFLSDLVDYCDKLLNVSEVQDYDKAFNGLQVQNSGYVTRIAATVDASLSTVRGAVKSDADLMIVHHGLFWSPSHPWVGKKYELIQELVGADLAVYSCHLPLDAHPALGNNAQLCGALGLKKLVPFFFTKGQSLGFRSTAMVNRDDLKKRLESSTGHRALLIPGGPKLCRRIGVVTGGAGGDLKKAADEGVDTFITGEGAHWTFALAEELGINVLYGGHYATETFGVKALSKHLSQKYRLPWQFIDYPTGL
jgi:dinuclear metal center YbgI/SA1388 family protein